MFSRVRLLKKFRTSLRGCKAGLCETLHEIAKVRGDDCESAGVEVGFVARVGVRGSCVPKDARECTGSFTCPLSHDCMGSFVLLSSCDCAVLDESQHEPAPFIGT